MLGNHLKVDPCQLQELGKRFSARADALESAIPGFGTIVVDVENAFGLLGPSDELHAEYLQLARESVEGLEHLHEALSGVAAGLSVTADNYCDAELGAAVPGLGMGGGS